MILVLTVKAFVVFKIKSISKLSSQTSQCVNEPSATDVFVTIQHVASVSPAWISKG